MVGSSYCISIDSIKELEEYKELLADIIDLAYDEMIININGGITFWNIIQLDGLCNTPLGIKIRSLQEKIDSQTGRE